MHSRNHYSAQQYAGAYPGVSDSSLLLTRVCFLTVYALICTALGSAVMWFFPSLALWVFALVGTFIMLFVCQAHARNYPANLFCLGVFAALEGMTLGLTLLIYARMPGGPLVIVQAALLSITIFAMVGTLGYTSSRSYSHWLWWLIGGLFALIVGGIVLWFVHSAGASWLYCVGGALLFVGFIFVDFNRIRHDFDADEYIAVTMEVYLDLINLFVLLLRLLGDSRRE